MITARNLALYILFTNFICQLTQNKTHRKLWVKLREGGERIEDIKSTEVWAKIKNMKSAQRSEQGFKNGVFEWYEE